MKSRASFYVPDRAYNSAPDVAALTAVYDRLLGLIRVLVLARDFSGVLKASMDMRRAARALMAGKGRASGLRAKFNMLRCPGRRAKVIADLGGVRKLSLWQAAMKRAIAREHKTGAGWQAAASDKPDPIITPQSRAAVLAEQGRREHIRNCARACDNPQILKDPFRVDAEGLFRLPPLPRRRRDAARNMGPDRQRYGAADYTYNPRKFTKLTGAFAPVMVWPVEFYIAERGGAFERKPASVFAFGKTPGAKRRPVRRPAFGVNPCGALRGPARRRRNIFAPP